MMSADQQPNLAINSSLHKKKAVNGSDSWSLTLLEIFVQLQALKYLEGTWQGGEFSWPCTTGFLMGKSERNCPQ